MKVKLSKTGQITVPFVIRLCLDARPGDEFDVQLKGLGRFQVTKLTRRLPIIGSTEQERIADRPIER